MGRRAGVIACAIWILCGAYASRFVTRGWIPHDEGTIGQSAERVLRGELPHRDFDELYTGGLTYLHAGAMRLFGINLVTPRLVLFAFFMAFLAAAYAVARRVSSPLSAAAVIALITVWSLPNYFVSLPSWYTLFFATFGILALMRYLESGKRGWLVAAGACGGVSVLTKITGAYYLLGALLFLLYVEQSRVPGRRRKARPDSWFWLITALPAALTVFLLLQERSASGVLSFAPLFAPALIVCGFVIREEWSVPSGSSIERSRRLLSLAWPFAAGAIAVVLPFALFYWSEGALSDLARGILIQPQRRLTDASIVPPSFVMLGLATPYAALLFVNEPWTKAREWLVATAVAAGLGTVLLLGNEPLAYRATWTVLRALPTVVAVVSVALLVQPAFAGELSELQRNRIFLLSAMTGMLSLVQFPYASPTYFYYCAPIVTLALVSIVSARQAALLKVHVIVAAFFFAFALLYTNRSYGWNLGITFIPYTPDTTLAVDRGGLVVSEDDARTYEELVRVLREHADGGTIYAAPDCPEVYFLSGFSNPARTIFDFLSIVTLDEQWTSDLLSRTPVRAAVINTEPLVSPRLDRAVESLLEACFPQSQRVGRFLVRW